MDCMQVTLICPVCVASNPQIWVVSLHREMDLHEIDASKEFLCIAVACRECAPWYRENLQTVFTPEYIWLCCGVWIQRLSGFFQKIGRLVTENDQVAVFSGRGLSTQIDFGQHILKMDSIGGTSTGVGDLPGSTGLVVSNENELRIFLGAW